MTLLPQPGVREVKMSDAPQENKSQTTLLSKPGVGEVKMHDDFKESASQMTLLPQTGFLEVKMQDNSKEEGSQMTSLPQSGLREVGMQGESQNVEHNGAIEIELEKGEGAEPGRDYERHQWSSKREYILSMVGYCVGIGNLWRFPYLCNRNGGGAFLIPFLLSLILCGLPLFFLESALGQFAGRSTIHIWSICPLVKGMGVSMVVASLLYCWYYNTTLAWSLYYLAMSFQPTLPWTLCGQPWNTPHCTDFSTAASPRGNHNSNSSIFASSAGEGNHGNASLLASTAGNDTMTSLSAAQALDNMSDTGEVTHRKLVSSAEEFWQHQVLQVSGGFDEPGDVVWYLAVALGMSTVFMFLGLIKGVRSSGKVVYVTATAPYLLLAVLVVRGATLPGARDGVLHYLTPDFSHLLKPQVWVEAALQVFYSLGPAWGVLPTLASYNKFNNNCLRDSVILTFVCEGTSIFGGFAIFSVLGYMAHETGVPVDKVVSSGPGLAFIVYPEAISRLPFPQLWSVLFFFMIFTLCCDSLMGASECVLTVLCDYFPRFLSRHRMAATAMFCAVMFLLSLPFVTQGGVYLFQLVDWFIAAFTLNFIGIIECVVIAWVYGTDRFGADIELMIGRKPPLLFKILWNFVTPILLLCLLVVTLMKYQPPTYGDYRYDTWGNVFGWTIALVSFVPIPILALRQLKKARGSLLQRLRMTTQPDKQWGPPGLKGLYHRPVA